jgi:hypothetical protein
MSKAGEIIRHELWWVFWSWRLFIFRWKKRISVTKSVVWNRGLLLIWNRLFVRKDVNPGERRNITRERDG